MFQMSRLRAQTGFLLTLFQEIGEGWKATAKGRDHQILMRSYAQAERLVWAEPERGAPHEPVDGLFAVAASTSVRVLAVLGFRAEREGFTTIECGLDIPALAPGLRPDGTPAFTSLIPGGLRAKLFSVADPHESAALALLALAAAES